jgi:hypothetical protein
MSRHEWIALVVDGLCYRLVRLQDRLRESRMVCVAIGQFDDFEALRSLACSLQRIDRSRLASEDDVSWTIVAGDVDLGRLVVGGLGDKAIQSICVAFYG